MRWGRTRPASTAPRPRADDDVLHVAAIGTVPWWLAAAGGDTSAEPAVVVEEGAAAVAGADVVHVGADALGSIRGLKKRGATVVADLVATRPSQLRRKDRRDVALADLVLVGSRSDLEHLAAAQPEIASRLRRVPEPVDLAAFAPEQVLAETRGRDLRRHRRLHRLAGPVVLYAGDYTDEGALELAVDAVSALRDERPEVRLAALPTGRLDPGYRDRCERKALALGHHGIVEWTIPPDDLPLWFAVADVALLQTHSAPAVREAQLALASGTPVVAPRLPVLTELVDDTTGALVPPGDLEATVAALAAILDDADAAAQLARSARSRAERDLDPAAARDALVAQWLRLARAPGPAAAIDPQVAARAGAD